MAVKFACQCGQRFKVRDADEGRTATCSSCLTSLIVPGADGEFSVATQNLPPRRKKRKPSALQKPELKKEIPDAFCPSVTPEREMHPVLVTIVALLLFVNGWQALKDVMYVPILMWVHYTIHQSLDDYGKANPEEEGVTPDVVEETQHVLYRGWVELLCGGLLRFGIAASLAGILTWRGYAVYYAIGFASLLFIVDSLLLWEFHFITTLNVVVICAIIVMLKKLKPIAWPRLMAAAAVPHRTTLA